MEKEGNQQYIIKNGTEEGGDVLSHGHELGHDGAHTYHVTEEE